MLNQIITYKVVACSVQLMMIKVTTQIWKGLVVTPNMQILSNLEVMLLNNLGDNIIYNLIHIGRACYLIYLLSNGNIYAPGGKYLCHLPFLLFQRMDSNYR